MNSNSAIVEATALLTAATATGAGSGIPGIAATKTYQAHGTTTAGAGAATILVQGSNDGTNWNTIGTISLTLATTTSSDSFNSEDRYRHLRGNVSAISGTGASVSLTVAS
jgi:hypothetical protein